jgi:membrane-bound metal-dependent hydrolase YbcI (DUF457 family)
MDHICFDIICIMYFRSFGRILEHFVNFLKWPEKKFEVIFRSFFRPLFLYLLEIYMTSDILLARSSSPNDSCQLHLKTRLQHLKTCFHCHSVFVAHTKTRGKIYMMLSLGISNDMSTEMMCEVMKTMFSEDTSERSDSLKPCSTKTGHFH